MDASRYAEIATLRDGRTVEIRALEPEDRAGLLENMSDDAHQGLGIASALMRHLVRIAGAGGVRQLIAEVLPDNAAMLKVFERCGLAMEDRRAPDVLHIALDLSTAAT